MQVHKNPFVRNVSGLVKELSWFDVFIISIAAPAASGILFYSVNTQANYPGGSVGVAFLIGMLLFLPVIYLVGLLSTAMPRAGSLYVAISRIVGQNIAYIAAMLFVVGQSMIAGVLGGIIMSILSGIFVASGNLLGSSMLLDIGASFTNTGGKLIGGIIWVLLFWVITLKGMRPFKKVMRFFFITPFVATFIIVILFLFTSKTAAMDYFNLSWGANAFQSILDIAKNNLWTMPDFSWSATIGVFLVVIWAYNGIEMASYAGGEVQNPNKSLLKGYMWGWLTVGLIYIVLAFVVFKPFGDFISAYDFVIKNHSDSLSQIMIPVDPSIPFYVMSIAPFKWLGILISFCIVLWFANSIPPIFLSTSRTIFALAMDRSVPEQFANYNQVNGAPTVATHLSAILAILGVFFYTFDISVVMGTLLFCTFFIFWLYGFAAILLPYRRPEIYKQLPNQNKILGFPVISIVGLYTFFFGWFVLFFTVREISYYVAFALAILITLIIIMYLFQQRKNAKEGVNQDVVYSQLPPE